MSDLVFRITPVTFNTVLYLYSERETIDTNPDYQRVSGVWSLARRQLLIDSLLNGLDLPKFYFQEYSPPLHKNGQSFQFAVIDGQQRLNAIWDFIDGKYALANDFELLSNPGLPLAGLTYNDLSQHYPRLQLRFNSTPLSVMLVQSSEHAYIEEMFTRLNDGVPLNAAEKRNALGGPLPQLIRDLSHHPFFKCLNYSNQRYKHLDLAAKFLLFESRGGVHSTKKTYLDQLVVSFKDRPQSQAELIHQEATSLLDILVTKFGEKDQLLRSAGMVAVYYLLYRKLNSSAATLPSRQHLVFFQNAVRDNRTLATSDIANANYELLEFSRLTQTPNDAYSLQYRMDVLLFWLHQHKYLPLP